MKYPAQKIATSLLSTYFLLGTQSVLAQSSVSAIEIGRCATIGDSLKRLACYDSIGLRVTKSKDGGRSIRDFQAEETRRLESETLDREKAAETQRVAAAEEAKREQVRTAGLAMAAKATSALQAIKKLQSRVETGISYRDYPAVLAEAKYAFSDFSESDAAEKLSDAGQYMRTSISHYERAAAVWRVKFSGRGRISEIFSRFENPDLYDSIVSLYGSRMRTEAQLEQGLLYAGALPVIWSEARTFTMKADDSIKTYIGSLNQITQTRQ